MRPTDQYLVLVNMDDEGRSVRITVKTAGEEFLDRTADLATDERRRFALAVDEPGTYTFSATIDGEATETLSINFDEYDVREGSNVFVEVDDGRADIYWEE